MKQISTAEERYKIWLSLLFMAALSVLLLLSLGGAAPSVSPARVSAASGGVVPQVPRRPWTAVGSTGAVDEDSRNIYAFGSSDIGFRAGAAGSVITARYNVTNTFDNNANPNRPGWRTLEWWSAAADSTIIVDKVDKI